MGFLNAERVEDRCRVFVVGKSARLPAGATIAAQIVANGAIALRKEGELLVSHAAISDARVQQEQRMALARDFIEE